MNNKKKKPVKKSWNSLKKTLPEIAFIEWEDHFASKGSWIYREDIKDTAMLNTSVGFVLKENKDTVVLALSRSDNGMAGECVTILKKCITKRIKL